MSNDDEPGEEVRALARDIEQIRAGMSGLSDVIREEVAAGGDPKLLQMLQEMEGHAEKLDLPEMIAEYDREKGK